MKRGPLHGTKVVELGTAIAGPMCGMLLGDMGADVIKVERPVVGDDSRRWGTPVEGESPYFMQYNRNKRSITLDIRTEKGQDILRRLVRRADVLIENFRPGTMKRFGLSHQQAASINPRLVYCSVSGFGQSGPYSGAGGYDAIIQGMCGLMSVTGEQNQPPMRVGAPITDILAALYAAFSVSLALLARERLGKGQWIDVSLFESGVSAVAQWLAISMLTSKPIPRFGNRYPLLAPYEPFETADLPIVVAVGNQDMWSKFCGAMNLPELVDDPRFRTNADRINPNNRKVLATILQEEFRKRPGKEWVELLWKADIPAGMINTVEELAQDTHLVKRRAFVTINHQKFGKISVVAPRPRFSLSPSSIRRPPPTLGQHTFEVLRELGLSEKAIKRCASEKII